MCTPALSSILQKASHTLCQGLHIHGIAVTLTMPPVRLHFAGRDYATLPLRASAGWIASATNSKGEPLSVSSRQGLSAYLAFGDNTIEFHATDTTGRVLECSVVVRVVDIEPPR